jgi:DNA-binding transcriptional LysR family regulator
MLSSWDDLRYLEAVDRLGNARNAGRELGVAPSTVYRRIAELEATVGFVCLTRGEGLTARGKELAAIGRETATALHEVERRAKDAKDAVRGSVDLTTIDGFAPLLAEPLGALARSAPQLRVNVQISDLGVSIRKRHAEVGLSILDRPPGTLVGRRLFPVRFSVFAHRSLQTQIATARWIVVGRPLHTTWLAAWEAKHVPVDRVAISTASRRLHDDLVADGAGLGLLPVRLAEAYPELVEVPGFRASTQPLTRWAWVLTHEAFRHDPRVTALMGALAGHLARKSG